MQKNRINLLTAGPETDEEGFVRELDMIFGKMGERVCAQKAWQQKDVIDRLRAEMVSLRPHAKRLLSGGGIGYRRHSPL